MPAAVVVRTLSDGPAEHLATQELQEAVQRSGLAPGLSDDVVLMRAPQGDERVLSSLGISDELKPENWLTPSDRATDRGHPPTWLESTT